MPTVRGGTGVKAEQVHELFARHQDRARRIAYGFSRKLPPNVAREDIEQAALIGLHQWCSAHPDSSQPGWQWGLATRVRGAIIDWLRSEDWLPRRARAAGAAEVLHLEDLRGDDGPGWQDILGEYDETEFSARVDALAALEADMPARDRHLVIETFARDAKQKDLARELGVTDARVSQLLTRATRTMREHLERPRVSVQVATTPKFKVRDFKHELWLARRNALWQRMEPGMSMRQLALKLRLPETTVYYWCTDRSRAKKFDPSRRDPISAAVRERGKELIAAAYRAEPAGHRAAALLQISHGCIRDWRRRLLPEIPLCPTGHRPRVDWSTLASLYESGLSQRQIAREVGMHPAGVGHALRKLGIVGRRRAPRRRDIPSEECKRLRDAGLSLKGVALSLHCSIGLVRRRLAKAA